MSVKNLEEYEKEGEQQQDQEGNEVVYQNNLKELYENQEQFMYKMKQLNEQGVYQIKLQKYSQAIKLLQQSEKMMEYASSCGKQIDKNLIIVILYNQACSYQCLWVLDKCQNYLIGVLQNLNEVIKEVNLNETKIIKDCNAIQVKQRSFLAKVYLQQTAILSQLGKHQQALKSARDAAESMRDVFKLSSEFCQDWLIQNGTIENTLINVNQKLKQKNNKFQMKDEVEFSRLVINSGKDILQDLLNYQNLDNVNNNEQLILKEAKKYLYFWKNNPLNNEKHIRKELKLNIKEDDYRSILGVQNVEEWIQTFNVSFIMHIIPITHSEFTQESEMLYEISQRLLLEKVIQLSISYFTIATELRFIELEKAKQQGIKEINTNEFKLSELYHLKAVEIACKHINCSSQYINHLITTYHKHYNSNLNIIQEESITSMVSEINYKQQKLQQLKQIKIQTERENQIIIQNLNQQKYEDSSANQRYIYSFRDQYYLKGDINVNQNIKNQANLFDQIFYNKRRLQMPSNVSPKQKFQFQNASTNTSCEKFNEKILKTQDSLTIQLQPYKSAKTALNQIIKKSPIVQRNNKGLLKSFLLESCRVQRQTFIQNTSPKPGDRSPEKSPYYKCKFRTSILQNKIPLQNSKLEIEQQFPTKLDAIKQLLIGKSQYNQKRK